MRYRCVLLARALRFLDQQVSATERHHILTVLEKLCEDPLADGVSKFYYYRPPAVFCVCLQEPWWIVYHFPGNDTFNVDNIGRLPQQWTV